MPAIRANFAALRAKIVTAPDIPAVRRLETTAQGMEHARHVTKREAATLYRLARERMDALTTF